MHDTTTKEFAPDHIVGIDLAKHKCDAAIYTPDRRLIGIHRNISYQQLEERLRDIRPGKALGHCVVLMEGCKGCAYYGRKIQQLGHDVWIVKGGAVSALRGNGHKNDSRDAQLIASLYFVPSTTHTTPQPLEHSTAQTIIRIRAGHIKARTAKTNEIHAFLEEFGHPIRNTNAAIEKLGSYLASPECDDIPEIIKNKLLALKVECDVLKSSIEQDTKDLASVIGQSDLVRRLEMIPGIGPMNAALLALQLVGNGVMYRNARSFSASLGLVPRQYSTGGNTTLLHITKVGDADTRCCLVQSAINVLTRMDPSKISGPFGTWVGRLGRSKKPLKVQACAVASKLARIAWALAKSGAEYDPKHASARPVLAQVA